jgi:hypothetical protein
MSIQNGIPNERQLVRAFAGIETFRGVPVAPDFKLYGDLRLTKARPLVQRREFTGTHFTRKTPARGPITVDGTYSQKLSYEDLAILPRLSVATGPTPVTDGEATPGYVVTYRPHATRNNFDTATVETLYPGLPFKAEMVHFPQFTISNDADDAESVWQFNAQAMARTYDPIEGESGTATGGSTTTVVKAAAGWTVNEHAGAFVTMLTGAAAGDVREIASNDATTLTIVGVFTAAVANTHTFIISGQFTAGIADRTTEDIEGAGTVVYFDADSGDIGTTPLSGRMISWSVTFNNNITPKRMQEDVGAHSKKLGKGPTDVSGQIRVEFDSRAEYDHWANLETQAIRFEQTGSTIDSGAGTTREARIDVFAAYYDAMTNDDRGSNVTATFTFYGYQDAIEIVPIEIHAKTEMAALP